MATITIILTTPADVFQHDVDVAVQLASDHLRASSAVGAANPPGLLPVAPTTEVEIDGELVTMTGPPLP